MALAAAAVAYAALSDVGGSDTGSVGLDNPAVLPQRIPVSPITQHDLRASGLRIRDNRHLTLCVRSAAMRRDVPVEIQRAADLSAPRPVLYLLNGDGGQHPETGRPTDVEEFAAGRNVHVAQPIGGACGYYIDWIADDPVLGRNTWQTFLTEELPPVVDAVLRTIGMNAIAVRRSSEPRYCLVFLDHRAPRTRP
ncbi:alpha/beta hydrolase-fold protein [Nocardia terpenica]|uniref:alpha/beta hydrolase-fold protein n=1 Tax=Nocardia terpenica TaxID=455432 RepID=UPI0012FE4FF2|nr:alpha/beta hydrolase-fold protein [Nocardia terpenica]